MKIWIKLFVGGIIGAVVGLLLPGHNEALYSGFSYASRLAINIGRYVVFPLVFFSLAIGIYELKRDKKILRVYGRTLAYLFASGLLLSIIGAVSVIVFVPGRIPVVAEQQAAFTLPSLKDILLQIFPTNFFQIFNNNGNYLLPIYVLSFLLGLNFTFDRLITRPAVQFFDSLSRIFFHVNSFIMEIMGIGMIAVTTFLVLQIRAIPDIGLFTQLLLVLVVDTVVVLIGIYPAILYFLSNRGNPFVWLYASLGPAITAMITGDSYFSLNAQLRNSKSNLGVPRKVGAATLPLFAIFGRAGTAMVTSASFFVIINSYSSLGITAPQAIWIVLFSFLVSLTLGSVPGMGAFVAIATLSQMYGGGYGEGYLILKPIAPLLMSFSVLLDVITASLSSRMVAQHERMLSPVEVKDFA